MNEVAKFVCLVEDLNHGKGVGNLPASGGSFSYSGGCNHAPVQRSFDGAHTSSKIKTSGEGGF
ncbi:TPA: hypothetical protein DCR79_00790 [Patescibacteria group bacterium]|nr:hypothetical protein [Patescibacteria group bacterium]